MKNTQNALTVLSRTCRGGFIVAFIAVLLGASVAAVHAQTYTVSVADSSLQVNTGSALLSGWTVGGVNQLANQSFFYSIGSNPASSISTLSAPSLPSFGGSGFGGSIFSTNIGVTYANSALSVSTKYTLGVNGTGASLDTTITVTNVSAGSESLNFYQYSHFVLGGTTGGQSVQFQPGAINYAMSQTGNGGLLTGQLSATVGGTQGLVGEIAGVYNGTEFGLLAGSPVPFNSSTLSASGSDVNFGYEFEATLNPGSTLVISEIQNVPEPSSLALFASGALVVTLLRRRGLALLKKY